MIDRRGIILTNNHVVEGARTRRRSRSTTGGTRSASSGEVVGTAAERDLAIIRVAAERPTPVPLGRSSRLRLGDGVLAIGFPLDLGGGPTVTAGHRLRPRPHGARRRRARRSRACCRPTRRSTPATPAARSSTRRAGSSASTRSPRRARPRTSASRSRSTQARAGDRRDPQQAGRPARLDRRHVRLDRLGSRRGAARPPARAPAAPPSIAVFADSPAAKAGLREGDVVVAINGWPVRSASDFAQALGALEPGRLASTLDVVDQSARGASRSRSASGRRRCPAVERARLTA